MQKLFFKPTNDQQNGMNISLTVNKTAQISKVKAILSKKIKADPHDIILRYKGHQLPNENSVFECNINNIGPITYEITSGAELSSEDLNDDYVPVLLINGPGKPIRILKEYTINDAKQFIAKVFNLPPSSIIYCNESNEKDLSLLSTKTPIDIEDFIQTTKNQNNEAAEDEYYSEEDEDDDNQMNQLLGDIPLNSDGAIHFLYQYKLLSFPVYLPNNLIAKSRCRDFATVDTVKDILAKKIEVQPESTVLTYNGEILSNDLKIRDIKFEKDGVFKLEYYTPKPPIRKIFIKISTSPVKHSSNGKLSRKTQTSQNFDGPEDDVLCAQAHFNEKATIGKAKEKLADFLNCEPENISLIFNDPSIKVNDDSLLKDLDIESNEIIDAEVDEEVGSLPKRRRDKEIRTVSIKLSNGLIAKGKFNDKATVKTMKEVIAKTLNTTTDCLSILNLNDSQSMDDSEINNKLIKDLLNEKYSPNSPFRNSKRSLKNYDDIDSESKSLSVEINDEIMKPVSFLLEDGKTISAQFKPSVTIRRAKDVLSKTLNIHPDRIIFKYKSPETDDICEASDDNELLIDMPVGKDGLIFTKIASFPKSPKSKQSQSNVNNHLEGSEYNNYSEDENEVIYNEKDDLGENEMIEEEEEDKSEDKMNINIEEEEEEVSYPQSDAGSDDDFSDDVKVTINTNEYSEVKVSLLDEAPIQRNKNLSNTSNKSNIHPLIFQAGSGKVAKTRFKDTATVGKLKDKMAKALDVNPGNMMLSFGSKDIDDNSLLKDVVNDAECDTSTKLVLKQSPTKLKVVKPLILRLEDGREIKSKFRILSTIGKVKETLSKIINTDPSTLVFYYEDEMLSDDLFLSEINILDNECIYVSQE